MKKATALFLSVLMVFSLTACGSRSGESAAEAAPSDSESAVLESGSARQTSEQKTENTGGKTLVVYFSATGNTESAADYIAEATGGDLFELEPEDPYTDADLDWTDEESRVVFEYENPDERQTELVESSVPDWESYDTVFIGYPIWWGIAAWPVDGFVADNDFTGKTVIPFCTSSTSGLGDSGALLEEAAGTGTWMEGVRFSSGVSEQEVQEWVSGLDLK